VEVGTAGGEVAVPARWWAAAGVGAAVAAVPELQSLAVGDPVPLSATRALFVRHLDAPHALVLELPDGPLAWVWSFTLHPVGPPAGAAGSDADVPGVGRPGAAATRLVIRTRAGARAGWVRPFLAPLDAGHLVMEAVQLQRLRRRVERSALRRDPDDAGW
jgi:hypothetical protein